MQSDWYSLHTPDRPLNAQKGGYPTGSRTWLMKDEDEDFHTRLVKAEMKLDMIWKAFWGLMAAGGVFAMDRILNLIGGA